MHPEAAPLATWAGQHALAIYVALLASLLGLTAVTMTLVRRHTAPPQAGAAPPPFALALRLALGFGAIVLGAWVFAETAEGLQARATLGAFDQALTDALRTSVPLPALQVFAALTHLADTRTLTVLCIVVALALVWRKRPWLAFGWVAAVAGNAVLNTTLKRIFERVRPLHDDGLVAAQGFSFPSGHSSGSVVAYGMLAYVLMRFVPPRFHLALTLAAAALAFSIGASRIFLRVHFASDVLAGFASGGVWLTVCIASIALTRRYRRHAAR
jgi:membrane-associated phospholipid phosphatase